MATAEDVLNQARKWLGFIEGPANANPFGVWYGWNNVSWCVEFVEYCFAMAGAPLPIRTASVNQLAGWAQSKGLWRPSTEAQPGDPICFDWTGTESGRDWNRTHIGICEMRPGGAVQTIEGNTSNPRSGPDGVFRKVWPAGYYLIWGSVNVQSLLTASNPPGQPNNRFAGEPIISRSSTGQAVKDFQNAINVVDANRGLAVDGLFGAATEQAARDFQTTMKLAVDGVVGSATWASLDFLLDQKGR